MFSIISTNIDTFTWRTLVRYVNKYLISLSMNSRKLPQTLFFLDELWWLVAN